MELYESKVGKVVFARLSGGEDLLESITQLADRAGVSAGFFFLIGTLEKANLGFFREGKYVTKEMVVPLEIASCSGNISIKEGKVFAHAHVVVSDERGNAFGGHVMPGCLVGITSELVLVEAKGINMLRRFDQKTKLFLLSVEKPRSKMKEKRSTSI